MTRHVVIVAYACVHWGRLAVALAAAFAVSVHGALYAWVPVLMSNWLKLLVSADSDFNHKIWGMFIGFVFWLCQNWLDRTTSGGKASVYPTKKQKRIDLNRNFPVSTETLQMNLVDANLFVCFAFVFFFVCV